MEQGVAAEQEELDLLRKKDSLSWGMFVVIKPFSDNREEKLKRGRGTVLF